jgi:hypothetical protein
MSSRVVSTCDLARNDDAEFFASQRFAKREAAIAWANEQRGEIEKGFTDSDPPSTASFRVA